LQDTTPDGQWAKQPPITVLLLLNPCTELPHFLQDIGPGGQLGLREVVMTFSSAHTDVRAALEAHFSVQVSRPSVSDIYFT
jgi:hypothetical protein